MLRNCKQAVCKSSELVNTVKEGMNLGKLFCTKP